MSRSIAVSVALAVVGLAGMAAPVKMTLVCDP